MEWNLDFLNDAPSTVLAPIHIWDIVKNQALMAKPIIFFFLRYKVFMYEFDRRTNLIFFLAVGSVFSEACHQYEVKSGDVGEGWMPLYGLTILTNCLVLPRA